MDNLKKLGNKGWAVLDVVGQQSNKLAHKLGSESFWPMSLDKECVKAAAILRTFTRDGFQVRSKGNKTKSLVKIPPRVLQQAKGLAIFTVFRTGLHISGAGGSGLLIARQPDGSWGPPSGILLHTLGVGALIGLDIYDTVLVLRTQEAVNAFAHPKISIGVELSVAAGPLGSGGALDMGFADKAPAWMYTKSRGFYAGIALDGTIVIERSDENERFYGRRITAAELIHGAVEIPTSTNGLIDMIGMAEGRLGMWEDITGASEQVVLSDDKSYYEGAPPHLPPGRSMDSHGSLAEHSPANFSSQHPGPEHEPTPPLPARRNTGSHGALSEQHTASSSTQHPELPPFPRRSRNSYKALSEQPATSSPDPALEYDPPHADDLPPPPYND